MARDTDDDFASLLELLELAVNRADRLHLPLLGHLLRMAVMEAADQARSLDSDNRRRA